MWGVLSASTTLHVGGAGPSRCHVSEQVGCTSFHRRWVWYEGVRGGGGDGGHTCHLIFFG